MAAALAALAGCGNSSAASGAGSTQGVQNAPIGATQSSNWSGYALTGLPLGFSQVGGTWTVPALDCSGGSSTASATWAGIGGLEAADRTLIQAGTEQDCSGGGASYYAWWEGYPEASQEVSTADYPVHAGDQVTVTIGSSLLVEWSISIHDVSAGWTFTTTTPFVAAGESAELIEEAPLDVSAGGSTQATLSDFAEVPFSALAANSQNPDLNVSDSIQMVNASGTVIASPSAPGAGGDSFDVCYGPGGCD